MEEDILNHHVSWDTLYNMKKLLVLLFPKCCYCYQFQIYWIRWKVAQFEKLTTFLGNPFWRLQKRYFDFLSGGGENQNICFGIQLGFPAKRENCFTKISHYSRPFHFIFAFRYLAKNAKIFDFSRNFASICFAKKSNIFEK